MGWRSRPTWTEAVVPWRRCWCSRARCGSATPSSPERPTGVSGRCSTSTATTCRRPPRPGPCRCSVWLRCLAPATPSWCLRMTGRHDRSPRSGRRPTVRLRWPSPASGSAWRTSTRPLLPARWRRSTSSSRATCPARSKRWRTRCCRSTSAPRSTCASSTVASARSRSTTSTSPWPPRR